MDPSEQQTAKAAPRPTSKRRTLTIGAVFGTVAGVWFMLGPVLGHMGWPWPCVAIGLGILAGTTFAYRIPDNRVGWSLVILFAATFGLLLGQGAVIPGLIGFVAGGLFMVVGEMPDNG